VSRPPQTRSVQSSVGADEDAGARDGMPSASCSR